MNIQLIDNVEIYIYISESGCTHKFHQMIKNVKGKAVIWKFISSWIDITE